MRYSTLLTLTSFIGLTSLVVLPTISGQTLAPVRRLPLNEPLETSKNMPPAPPRKIETSPRVISQFGVFTSYQANVDASGNNILDDAANEPAIAVDPTDSNKMTIGWRQFDSIQSDFRQGGWGYTTDAGVHWTFPGVLEPGVFRSDPVTHSDEIGTFFYLSLLGDNFCDDVWRSTNGGQSWLQGGPGHGGDKEWFTIDKTGGPGHGFQYQFWSGFFPCDSGEFSRSTDGGLTWMSPINVPNDTDTGALDVDTNGNLFIGGSDFSGQFRCLRSSNAQIGNQTPTFDQNTLVNLGGFLIQGGINGIGLCGQTFIAIDRSGTATNNNIYMLASVLPNGQSTTEVMLAGSTDGGVTFSAPVRINDDANHQSKWHYFGTLSVAPTGRIDVVWYDTRNAANNIDSQLFYSYSTDAGLTWAPNIAVSDAFNPQAGFPQNEKIGDYVTIVSDNTGGNVAYAATFNVNPNAVGGHEQDVYYVRVSPSGGGTPTPTPRPIMLSAASRLTHGSAGTFAINMPLTGTSGVEDRDAAGSFLAVFTFDAAVTSGNAAIVGGTATAGTPTFSGKKMRVPLTGVADVQIVTIRISNVNGGGGTRNVAFGFLKADVNANRTVGTGDLTQINADMGQIVNSSNFRDDINLSGRVDLPDKNAVNANMGHHIP
jgi:hypothetical protein